MGKNRWDDHYTLRAREEKWLARSVYKLREIDKKFRLIHKGQGLLDLGCYPGSWSQYGIKRVGAQGDVVGIDLRPPDRLFAPNFRFIQKDVLGLDLAWLAREVGPRDVVMSDLAPQTTGIRLTDVARSMVLVQRAAEIALTVLKTGGHFVCKVLEGAELKSFQTAMASHFSSVRRFRPRATRKASTEVYVVGSALVKGARDALAFSDKGH